MAAALAELTSWDLNVLNNKLSSGDHDQHNNLSSKREAGAVDSAHLRLQSLAVVQKVGAVAKPPSWNNSLLMDRNRDGSEAWWM
ncbi:MAG: hypothetical protein ACK52U_04720 [Synechococcaceae cyanobacterium]|jgi:hypothetical protein